MAAVGLVDAQDQADFFQLLQGAINGDQANTGVILARLYKHLGGIQGELAFGENFHHGLARTGQPVSAGL